jgi:hypothetical protein
VKNDVKDDEKFHNLIKTFANIEEGKKNFIFDSINNRIDEEESFPKDCWGDFCEYVKSGKNKFVRVLFNGDTRIKGRPGLLMTGYCNFDGTSHSILGISLNDVETLTRDIHDDNPVLLMMLKDSHFFPMNEICIPKNLFEAINESIRVAARKLCQYIYTKNPESLNPKKRRKQTKK